MAERHFGDELERAWEAIRRGQVPPAGLAAWLVETLHDVHARDRVPSPDPTFVRELREELMAVAPFGISPAIDHLSLPNGRPAFGAGPSAWPAAPVVPRPRRWVLGHLATAALLLLTLAASVLTIGPGRLDRQLQAPALIPAISGTPATPESMTTETLFDAAVDSLPTAWGYVALIRWTLQPSNQPLVFPPTNGAQVFVVESGEFVVTVDGVEHRLVTGDTYVLDDPEQEIAFRLIGPEDALLLRGVVITLLRLASADPFTTSHEFLLEYSTSTLPGGSGRLVAEELTLPPGGALPPQEASPLVWFAVGPGTLGLTLEGDELPGAWTAGQEKSITRGRLWPQVPAGTQMTMRNAGVDPLVLYRMELMPDTAAAATGTPAS